MPYSKTLFQPGERVNVIVPVPAGEGYTYTVPPGTTVPAGARVEVPLGSRRLFGTVHGPGDPDVPAAKLKSLIRGLETPPATPAFMKFADWVAAYVMAPRGAVEKMALPVPDALTPPPAETVYTAGDMPAGLRLTPARRAVLAVLDAAENPLSGPEIAEKAEVSRAVVRGLADAGALAAHQRRHSRAFPLPDPHHAPPVLTPEQETAAETLSSKIKNGFSVTLLDGPTGSGKTEVYFDAMARAFEAGQQVLILLPEIALAARWPERFAARFGIRPAIWHSSRPPAARRDTWRAVAEGKCPVVVGARSALFLPFQKPGLIVVDEEHEGAFKQEEGVLYNARDMAVVRGRMEEIPVILSSATPALETVVNVKAGRYDSVRLTRRHGGAVLPQTRVVDMRRAPPEKAGEDRGWLSPPLVSALEETLAAGEQGLLFLNRRGYAPLTLCRSCGHRLQCPHCSAWLVEHRQRRRFVCHHCGFDTARPPVCPACEAEDSWAACGPGVERVAEEVQARFDITPLVMSSDTLPTPAALSDAVGKIEDGSARLIVGTQVLAKGHHFPNLTLVGVVDADLGLAGGDLRAGEKTFQILHQVAGRAGRGEKPGRAFLQTYAPDHPVMGALVTGDRDTFLSAEADERKAAGMPPFGRLAALIVSAPHAPEADEACRQLARYAPALKGVRILGPAEAPLSVLRGRHRRRFLVITPRHVHLQRILAQWLAGPELSSRVNVRVDIDPWSFM